MRREVELRKHLTVGRKLAVSFGIVLSLGCLLSYSSLETVRRLGGMLDVAVNEDARTSDLIGAIKLQLHEMKEESTTTQFAYAVSGVLTLSSRRTNTAKSLGDCASCHTVGAADDRRKSFAALANRAEALAGELRPLVHSERASASLDAITGAIGEWRRLFGEFVDHVSRNDFASGHALVTDKMEPLLQRVGAAADALEAEQQVLRSKAKASAGNNVGRSRWTTLALMILSFLCGAWLAVTIRQTNRQLRAIAAELNQEARRVSVDADEVQQASRALEAGASEQSASIEETSASSEQVSATARRNAEHAAESSGLIKEVQRHMTETNQVLDQTTEAMQEIAQSSQRISNIIKVINEIAFQTNLLALNAAVEAARAGEAGMGFAVVADEVRTLAQRCADAAKDTENLIGDSMARSKDGKSRLDQLTERIRHIAHETESITTLADEVQSGSREQAQALQEIGKALLQMQATTEKTAANAEQGAAVGARLSAESKTLEGVVERLDAMVGGSGRH